MKKYKKQILSSDEWNKQNRPYLRVRCRARYAARKEFKALFGTGKPSTTLERTQFNSLLEKHFDRLKVLSLKPTALEDKKATGISQLIKNARQRAKREGVEFKLSREDFPNPPTTCPVLGIPIYYLNQSPNGDQKASLDRIDNNRGYVPGNVYVISLKANRMKGDNTVDTLESLINYIKNPPSQ